MAAAEGGNRGSDEWYTSGVSAAALLQKLGRPATLDDLAALSPELKGEIIEGELYVQPRPRARHARVEAAVVGSTSVSQLREGSWLEVAVHGDDERVRLAPLPEVELELSLWWAGGEA